MLRVCLCRCPLLEGWKSNKHPLQKERLVNSWPGSDFPTVARGGQGPADPRPHPPHLGAPSAGPALGRPQPGSRLRPSVCPAVAALSPLRLCICGKQETPDFFPSSVPPLSAHQTRVFHCPFPPARPGQAWSQGRGCVIAEGRQTYLTCKGSKSYLYSLMFSERGVGARWSPTLEALTAWWKGTQGMEHGGGDTKIRSWGKGGRVLGRAVLEGN